MEYIVLVYTNEVQGLISSALQKHKNKPIDGVEIALFNGYTQKFKNYVKKYKVDKVYLHSRYHRRIKEEIESLSKGLIEVCEYDSSLEYEAKRVPGNKFKTVEYYLYEYIKYKDKHKSKVSMLKDLEIDSEVVDMFERLYPHVKYKVYYTKREEAEKILKDKIEQVIQTQYDSIAKYTKQIEHYIKLKEIAENRVKSAVNVLLEESKRE